MRTIYASGGESVALEVTLTDSKGADLSTFTFTYGWGSLTGIPTTWLTPTSVNTTTAGKAVLTFTVNNTAALGTFFLWIKVVDTNGGIDYVRVSNEEVAVV